MSTIRLLAIERLYLVSQRPHPFLGGTIKEFKFPNSYGASVIQTSMSYGGDRGLWEIAVLDREGEITYDTPITSDVIGYVSEDKIHEYLMQILRL